MVQFVQWFLPERHIKGVVFHPATQSLARIAQCAVERATEISGLLVHLDDEAPTPQFMGGTYVAKLPDEPIN